MASFCVFAIDIAPISLDPTGISGVPIKQNPGVIKQKQCDKAGEQILWVRSMNSFARDREAQNDIRLTTRPSERHKLFDRLLYSFLLYLLVV